jgi:D-tagatose-1,6-bisphosphate aldolase subunit GatZ/KbaZ
MSEFLQNFLRTSRGVGGIYAVCSAHSLVIEAAMRQAQADGTHLLLEATSNQVNQTGGYTGMTPADYRAYVSGIARASGFDPQLLILGGDHLGPNPWQHLDAKTAMKQADEMVRMYVAAGFSKIHLDASMRCADDPTYITEDIRAERAAVLCHAAEVVRKELDLPSVVYVIGTEVPTPGGAMHAIDKVEVTTCAGVERTLDIHRNAFYALHMESAWERVIAAVVQPGVEFNHDTVIDYSPAKAEHLQSVLRGHPELVMEAHSSDYQRREAYVELIRDGFAILKVGPALTFAMREMLYSLCAIERELVPVAKQSRLVEIMDKTMLSHPADWQKYYHGNSKEQQLLRVYSYSDRIRYYWRFPCVARSVTRLMDNLRQTGISETMLSQHCPLLYAEIRQRAVQRDPKEIVIAGIRAVLKAYSEACRTRCRPSQTD